MLFIQNTLYHQHSAWTYQPLNQKLEQGHMTIRCGNHLSLFKQAIATAPLPHKKQKTKNIRLFTRKEEQIHVKKMPEIGLSNLDNEILPGNLITIRKIQQIFPTISPNNTPACKSPNILKLPFHHSRHQFSSPNTPFSIPYLRLLMAPFSPQRDNLDYQ